MTVFGGSNDKAPTATTNGNGRYRLTGVVDGQNLVHAFSDDYAPAMKTVSVSKGTETTADFTLKVGKPVTGKITDVNGKPVAGVWLVTDTWNGVRMFKREDRTNSQGEFTLAHMPESITEVDILKSGFISHRNYKVRGGDTLDLTMKPVITHTITIRDAAKGKIVPKLQISKGYLWEGNTTWSWRNDDWETTRYYDKLKGAMKIEIDEPFRYQVAYRFRATGYKEEIVNIPAEATKGKEFQVELKPASVFSGRVVYAPNGKPLGQVAVAIVNQEDRFRPDYYGDFTTPWDYFEQKRFTGQYSITDRHGVFRLSPPSSQSGSQLVLVSKPNAFHVISDLDAVLVTQKPGSDLLELPLPQPGTIQGRVTVAGKPLADTRIRLAWTGYDGMANRGNQAFGFGGRVTTDAEGFFKYENIGPGKYQIMREFSFELGQGSWMSTYIDTQNVVLLPGQTVTHDLVQPAGVSLSGVTRDADGNPVGNCFVKVNVNGNNSRQVAAAASAADGTFKIDHLAPGSYNVSAQHYSRSERGYNEQDMMGSTVVELSEATDDVAIEMGTTQNRTSYQRVIRPITGTLAPNFSVTPVGSNEPFTLSDKFRKVTVVCFWGASWLTNAATISSTYEKFKDNPDVEFLTVFLRDLNQFRTFKKHNQVKIEFPVATTQPNLPGQIPSVFGVTGQTACFVIGRNGRFAAEQTTPAQLATTIENALAQQQDIELVNKAVSRLAITLSTDGSTRGVGGAQVRMKSFEADGRLAREDQYSLTGVARLIDWRYPRLADGGKLEVTVSRKGMKTLTETVNNPKDNQTLEIDFESPRRLTGKIVSEKNGEPVAGMHVRIQAYGGEILTATSDAEGRFSVRCFPGHYQVAAVGNNDFASQTGSSRMVEIPELEDPKPFMLRVHPAVTVKGQVVDKAGEPVEGATVLYNGLNTVVSDSDGTFELPGIASTGKTVVWAMASENGAIWLTSPDVEKTYKITLGVVPKNGEPTSGEQTTDGKVSEFEITTLSGEKTNWQPEAEADRLLVFCALWHPSSKAFLEKAGDWSEENDTLIEVVSLDWNLDQARREAESLKLEGRTFFAGPGQLKLDSQWPLTNGRRAFLIDADGKLKGTPLK